MKRASSSKQSGRINKHTSYPCLPLGGALSKCLFTPLNDLERYAELFSQDCRDAQVSAKSLVAKGLVQVRRGAGYLVHDLLLDFATNTISVKTKEVAISRQAQYLGRLDVLKAYSSSARVANGGCYSLMGLWRSLENLAGDRALEMKTYENSLEALKQSKVNLETASSFDAVASLFLLQVR